MTFNFLDMLDHAKSEGKISQPPPNGHYILAVKSANHGTTTKGDPKFGIQFAVQAGPEQGKTFWENVNFIKGNAQNLAISFRTFEALGLSQDFMAQNPAPEQIVSALVGAPVVEADVTFETNAAGYTNTKMRKLKRYEGPAGIPATPVHPQPTQPPQPAAVPVPQQPVFAPPAQPVFVPPAQPVPAAVPAAVPQPVPVPVQQVPAEVPTPAFPPVNEVPAPVAEVPAVPFATESLPEQPVRTF